MSFFFLNPEISGEKHSDIGILEGVVFHTSSAHFPVECFLGHTIDFM